MLYNRLLNFEKGCLLTFGITVPGPIYKDTVIRRHICFVMQEARILVMAADLVQLSHR
jgi:phosphoribosyl-dephospho-CoA transferase